MGSKEHLNATWNCERLLLILPSATQGSKTMPYIGLIRMKLGKLNGVPATIGCTCWLIHTARYIF